MKKLNCILLIDDDETDNEFHINRIIKAGICNQVKIATDGEKGLEYLLRSGESGNQKEYPKADLIYLDINMPRMNGFEFLEEYVKLSDTIKARTLIIMLTTSLNPADEIKAKNFGVVSEYQNKPLTVESVTSTFEKYFQA